MTTFLGIGGVSATLQSLLEDRMPLPSGIGGDDFEVTIGVPKPDTENGRETARVNLYLYRVTRNGALANQDIPGRSDPGSADQPPLPLNLHYLVTAYGNTTRGDSSVRDQTISHFLLGSAMQVLHETPIVTEAMLDGDGDPVLHGSLRGEFERIKMTLEPLSIEDASKVWTALTEPFRVSAAYEVSVVQIEPRGRRLPSQRVASPPAGPNPRAIAAAPPRVEGVAARTGAGPERPSGHARIGDTLIIRGQGFAPEGLRVRLGPVDATGGVTAIAPDAITVVVPDDSRLGPGAQPVQVARVVPVGSPPQPREAAASNAAAFMLVPRVDAVAPPADPADPWVVTGKRLFDASRPSMVLIGAVPLRDPHYRARAEHRIEFDMPADVPTGQDSAVRVRVNAVESIDDVTVSP